jgi:hypothetical protein
MSHEGQLSLNLINYASPYEHLGGVKLTTNLNLGSRRKDIHSFTHTPLYSRGIILLAHPIRGWLDPKKNSLSAGNQTPMLDRRLRILVALPTELCRPLLINRMPY